MAFHTHFTRGEIGVTLLHSATAEDPSLYVLNPTATQLNTKQVITFNTVIQPVKNFQVWRDTTTKWGGEPNMSSEITVQENVMISFWSQIAEAASSINSYSFLARVTFSWQNLLGHSP